jgi:flagellar biosynthetic protein FlhB
VAGEDRTEQATPRRRQEARERGQVAKSTDLNSALGFVVSLAVIQFAFSLSGRTVAQFMVRSTAAMVNLELTEASAVRWLAEAGTSLLIAAAPVLGAAMLTGITANLAQVGFVVAPKALMPQLSRLDIVAGLGRMMSKRSLVELGKAIAKAVVVGYFGYTGLRARLPGLLSLTSADMRGALAAAGGAILSVGTRMAIPILAIGIGDYIYQRLEFEKNLRMTKQEAREELKQQEGDPLIRGRIRARQRQMAMHRMMQEVKRADVVVTNPTHYAVALRYDAERMRAPKVVAKGQRLIALRIREIAREAGVPTVENPPVAQALYKTVEIGHEIPPELYRAVAEVLAFVYRLSGERAKGGVAGGGG